MTDVWLPKGSSFKSCDIKVSNKFIILFCSDGFTCMWRIHNFMQGKIYDYHKYFRSKAQFVIVKDKHISFVDPTKGELTVLKYMKIVDSWIYHLQIFDLNNEKKI